MHPSFVLLPLSEDMKYCFSGAIHNWQPKHCPGCELGRQELKGLHKSISGGELKDGVVIMVNGEIEIW